LSEDDQVALALLTLAVDLAKTAPVLTDWGREHTALIDAQPDAVFNNFRARFADRLAVLKETER
jgi:hypothetical protein